MKFLKPFLVYGLGTVTLKIFYEIFEIISIGREVAYKGIIFESLMGLLYVILPTILGTYIHRKYSNMRHFGGMLSGIILAGLSAVFVAAIYGIWDLYNERVLEKFTFIDFSPLFTFGLYAGIGLIYAIPVGLIVGGIFHRYLVESKS